jgi:hypothetical protein
MAKTKRKRKKNQIKVVYRGLGREGAVGLCYMGENYIEIEKSLHGKKKFRCILHECLHDQFPNESERKILEAERVIGNTLWNENYRIVEQ